MKASNLLLASALVLGSTAIAFAQVPAGAPAGGGAGGARGGAMRAACGNDIQTLCAGKQGPEIRQCMMDNQSKLSDSCKAAMAQGRGAGAPPPGR